MRRAFDGAGHHLVDGDEFTSLTWTLTLWRWWRRWSQSHQMTKWWRSRFTLEISTARQGLGPGYTPFGLWWMKLLTSRTLRTRHLRWMPWPDAHQAQDVGRCPKRPQEVGSLLVLYQRLLNWRRNMRSSTIWPIETQQLPGIKRFLSPLNESHNWVVYCIYIFIMFFNGLYPLLIWDSYKYGKLPIYRWIMMIYLAIENLDVP